MRSKLFSIFAKKKSQIELCALDFSRARFPRAKKKSVATLKLMNAYYT